MAKVKAISLGWGVQSWTLAAMSTLGEVDPVDYVINSDTTWERKSTYEFAAKWGKWLTDRGVNLITVSNPERAAQVNDSGGVFIPAFTISQADDVHGQLRRQCTHDWKIIPIRRFLSDELKRLGIAKTPNTIDLWLGITTDEWQRAKDSDVKYITHRYPLLDKKMSRGDCLNWLQAHGLPSPGKSSCTFCPYHSNVMWAELKRNNGPDWAQAVAVDKAIRDKRPPYPLFIHSARVPLSEAVVIPEDHGATQLQLLNFDDQDTQCDSGYCFL